MSAFASFALHEIAHGEVTSFARVGGSGPPLLLLHGYPQTHVCWHKIAPELARHFTVVLTDLRGYGDSSKPFGAADHSTYSKRAMARDQVAVMRALGFGTFQLVGHDRGGRVSHRLMLDHPGVVDSWAVLDIAPTLASFERTSQAFATANSHWFFLSQPYDFPERLIGADAEYYLRWKLGNWTQSRDAIPEEAMREYLRCFREPEAIHASCEDYRAAAGIDLEHDRADLDRKVTAPLLALWGMQGRMAKLLDIPALWRERVEEVQGRGLDCGHFLQEEKPEEVLEELLKFLAR
jgi:haloacetate dehalogenase